MALLIQCPNQQAADSMSQPTGRGSPEPSHGSNSQLLSPPTHGPTRPSLADPATPVTSTIRSRPTSESDNLNRQDSGVMSVTPAHWHEPRPADPTLMFKFKLEPPRGSSYYQLQCQIRRLAAARRRLDVSLSESAESDTGTVAHHTGSPRAATRRTDFQVHWQTCSSKLLVTTKLNALSASEAQPE